MTKVKVINWIKVISRSNCEGLTFYQQAGSVPSTEKGILVICCKYSYYFFTYLLKMKIEQHLAQSPMSTKSSGKKKSVNIT